MTRFRYQATDAQGRPVDGEIAAESLDAARQELAARGLSVSDLREVVSASDRASSAEPISLGRLSETDMTMLASRLAQAAQSGLPLTSGLRALAEEVSSRRLRLWLHELSDRLDRGESLSSLMRTADGAWPRYFVVLIDAGQRTGQLPVMLTECAEHLRVRSEQRRQWWLALAYPLILATVAWLLLTFLATWIVPQMREVFRDFGIRLPGLTLMVLNASAVIEFLYWWFPPAVVVLACLGWRACESFGYAGVRDRMANHVPLWGELRCASSLAELCRLLSLLVRFRVTLPEAIRLASTGVQDADLGNACRELALRVEAGESLSQAAAGTRRFPPDLVNLFRWADREDEFAKALQTAAEVFAAKSRIQARMLTVICEPVAAVTIGAFLALTVVGLFMPLFTLLESISS